jgi:multidrug efflux pump subunit AcrB
MSDPTRREFGPTNLAIRNRTSIAALVFIIALLGTGAYVSIPKEASPEITR